MPDTAIPADTAIPPDILGHALASLGVMGRYRSPLIGELVAARAKANPNIKKIIKDKTATIPSKTGGRGFGYSFANLADVLDAGVPALSEQGLALFQTTQDRGRDGTFLVTTLAHESDQWISAEIRLRSVDQGPQAFGSEMSYLRRYEVLAILGLAPDDDDDGRAAQDRHVPTARPQAPPVERESPLITLKMPGAGSGDVSFPRTKAGVGAALKFMAEKPETVILNLAFLDAVGERMPDFADQAAEVRAIAAASLTPQTQAEVDRQDIENHSPSARTEG